VLVETQEIVMASKFNKQVIICPRRKREVEVTFTVSGNWFAPDYKVVACPAMYEGDIGCDRICQSLLARPASYQKFVVGQV